MTPRRSRPLLRSLRSRRSPAVWLILILAALLLYYRQHEPAAPDVLPEGVYEVERVVDGDTLVLSNRARLRLIGADTPETVAPNRPVDPWGPEATEFTEQFVAEGTVRITLDRERVDRYERFLAYVWVGDRMLNEELIRAGLAKAQTHFRYNPAMKKRFRRAEEEARIAGRAIWSGREVGAQ